MTVSDHWEQNEIASKEAQCIVVKACTSGVASIKARMENGLFRQQDQLWTWLRLTASAQSWYVVYPEVNVLQACRKLLWRAQQKHQQFYLQSLRRQCLRVCLTIDC